MMKAEIRRRTLAAAVLLLLVGATGLLAEDLNRIVLRINDEILTLHDYEKRKAGEITAVLADPRLSTRERQERISQIGPRVMQELFRELLLLSRGKQDRVRVSDREVEESILSLMEQQGIPDENALNQALASAGMTMKDLRDKMQRDMVMGQVVSHDVTSQIDVGEEELRAFYRNHEEEFTTDEKRWLKEVIVLEGQGREGEELEALAAEVKTALEAGGELETAIEPFQSAGLTTGVIDLDWLREDELDPTLSEVAFALEPGAFSDPVVSRGGLHILHLAGLEEAEVRPYEEVERLILNRERGLRFDKALNDFLAQLEAEAFVRENLPPEAVGYRSLAADYSSESKIELFRQETLPLKQEEEPAEGTETEESGG